MITHWGRVTQICVDKLTAIGSDNGLALNRRQAIIWINAGILFIGSLRTNFRDILIEIHPFSFKKMNVIWKMAAIFCRAQFAKKNTLSNSILNILPKDWSRVISTTWQIHKHFTIWHPIQIECWCVVKLVILNTRVEKRYSAWVR